MRKELLETMLFILILPVIFSSGCVFDPGVDGYEVEGISVLVWEWKENDTSMGLVIHLTFGDDTGGSIKVVDEVNVKMIYEKDTSNESKVYDKMIEIKEELYTYSAGGGHFCNLYMPYSNFNGSYIVIRSYTVIVEYKGVSGSGSSKHIYIPVPVIFFNLDDANSPVSSDEGDELFTIAIRSGNSIKFSEMEIQVKYTSEGAGADNLSDQWIFVQIESTKTNQEGDLIAWTKNTGYYSSYGGNENPTDHWDVGEEFVICETGEKDLIKASCTVHVQIIYTPVNEVIAEEYVSVV